MTKIRSTIKPTKRTRGDRVYWIARGTYPHRLPSGVIERKFYEEGITAKGTMRERQDYCDRLNKSFEDRAMMALKPKTFSAALDIYIGLGNSVPYFYEELVRELGEYPCTDITDSVMLALVDALGQSNASPAYVNRHIYTPVIAVLGLAARGQACPAPTLSRPKGHDDVKPIEMPEDISWYGKVAKHLSPSNRAFLLAQSVHGRRTAEWLSRKKEDYDPKAGTIYLGRTKNGKEVMLHLHPKVVTAFDEMLAAAVNPKRPYLFGTSSSNSSRVRSAIRRACDAAGVEYYTPHKFGRHAAVSRALMAGKSVKWVSEMYGMSPDMVLRRYGHLVRKEVDQSVHEMGDAVFLAIDPAATGGDACVKTLVTVDKLGKTKLLAHEVEKEPRKPLNNKDNFLQVQEG